MYEGGEADLVSLIFGIFEVSLLMCGLAFAIAYVQCHGMLRRQFVHPGQRQWSIGVLLVHPKNSFVPQHRR